MFLSGLTAYRFAGNQNCFLEREMQHRFSGDFLFQLPRRIQGKFRHRLHENG